MECKNLIGTYMCICGPGYQRRPDGEGCVGKIISVQMTHYELEVREARSDLNSGSLPHLIAHAGEALLSSPLGWPSSILLACIDARVGSPTFDPCPFVHVTIRR